MTAQSEVKAPEDMPEKAVPTKRTYSKKKMAIPRADKDIKGRPERVMMGSGRNLYVPQAVLDEIDALNCVPRWCLDNEKGRMEQYLKAKYVPYTDAKGNQITAASGHDARYVLMVLDKGYHEQGMALKRKRNNARIQTESQLRAGEYIPNDQRTVMADDLY